MCDNFKEFVQEAKPEFQFNWHHDVICEYVDRWLSEDFKNLMILAPPRSGKSELISRLLTAYLFSHKPGKIRTDSYNALLSNSLRRDSMRIVLSEDVQIHHPVFSIDEIRNEIVSGGVGTGITGNLFEYSIMDDLIKNRQEDESEEYLNKAWSWYSDDVCPHVRKQVMVASRWCPDDVPGRILGSEKILTDQDWVVLVFPFIAEKDSEYRRQGDILWNRLYPADGIKNFKQTVGNSAFSSLYQQNPIKRINVF